MTKDQEDAILQQAEEIKSRRVADFHVKAAEAEQQILDGKAFSDAELRYSAHAFCKCGAGLAYPLNIGMQGSWMCSEELKGILKPRNIHNSLLCFTV